jgi:WD40 repeat protein
LEGHLAWVAQIAFSADGKTLASVGSDGMRLWNVAAGRETLVFEKALMAAGTLRSIASSALGGPGRVQPRRSILHLAGIRRPDSRRDATHTLEEIDRQAMPPGGE